MKSPPPSPTPASPSAAGRSAASSAIDWRELAAHSVQPAPFLRVRAAAIPREGGGLRLAYTIAGDLDCVVLPDDGAALRVDGLWQHTCCEAFVAVAGDPAYREFNFSPAGAWAAYAFSDYRSRAALPLGPVPAIACQASGTQMLSLVADLDAAWLPRVPRIRLGLCAVIETRDGARSYWALAHPAAQPDFHHRDGFALTCTLAA